MNDEDFELVRGSRNVFRDLDHPDADVLQAKAIITAESSVLDDRAISVRRAYELTGSAGVATLRGTVLCKSCDLRLRPQRTSSPSGGPTSP